MYSLSRFVALSAIAAHLLLQAHAQDAHMLSMQGANLSAEEVAKLESKVEETPEDTVSRTKLLGYYSMRQYRDRSVARSKRTHVLWFIENAPDSAITGLPDATIDAVVDPEGYVLAKKAWLKQAEAHADDAIVLGNAAEFFTLPDRDLAKDLFHQAHELEPENPHWLEQMGHLHGLNTHSDSEAARKAEAAKAVEYYEQALALSRPNRRGTLQYIAQNAYIAEEYAKARGYATQMVKLGANDWNAGNNVHHGNLVLGLLALREGDTEQAKAHLIAAGETPGSPQLNSFGPDFSLARDLLAAGESEVVLEYLELCSKFWKRNELDVWAKEIRAGLAPDFSFHSDY